MSQRQGKRDSESAQRQSPLYTPPSVAKAKKAEAERLGRDKDGAWRVGNRKDGKE